jgi:CIC family chloride channel protein
MRVSLFHAAIVGAVAGALAVLFQVCVKAAEGFGLSAAVWSRHHGVLGIALLTSVAASIGGSAAYLISRYSPESGGSGIPHVKAALMHLRVIRPLRVIFAKFAAGLAALGVGMSMGREGPSVQIGACVGKLLGDKLRAPRRGRNALIAAGAGAGLAAAFNAPLAGFLFVMEELKREMSALTYGSALIACVTSVAVCRYVLGEQPSFKLPSPGTAPLTLLPLAAVLGVVAGLAGVGFNKALIAALQVRLTCKIPPWIYGVTAAILSGFSLMYFPEITGGGHSLTESLLIGDFRPGITFALLIFLSKILLTAISYGTGLPGGIFAPILVIGSFLGYAFGSASHSMFPGIAFSDVGFATLGMSALLAGSVRAPLTGTVLIVEMTGEYGLLYALLVAAFCASLVADFLRNEPIYDALMERDLRLNGAEVHPEKEPILLELLVEPDSPMDGKRIQKLGLPAGAIVATVERGSRFIVPSGGTVIDAGDMITVMIDGAKPELSIVLHGLARAPS